LLGFEVYKSGRTAILQIDWRFAQEQLNTLWSGHLPGTKACCAGSLLSHHTPSNYLADNSPGLWETSAGHKQDIPLSEKAALETESS